MHKRTLVEPVTLPRRVNNCLLMIASVESMKRFICGLLQEDSSSVYIYIMA